MLEETFKDFQPETPRDLWPEIETELNQRSRKRGLWTYLSIAAAIIVLLGIIFSLRIGSGTVKLVPAGKQSIAQMDTTVSPTTASGQLYVWSQAYTPKEQLSTAMIPSHTPKRQAERDKLTFPKMPNDSIKLQSYAVTQSQYSNTTTPQSQSYISEHQIAAINFEQFTDSSQVETEGIESPVLSELQKKPKPIEKREQLHEATFSVPEPIEQASGATESIASVGNPSNSKIIQVDDSRAHKLTFESALFIASTELDKLVKNSPFEASEKQIEDDEVIMRTIQFQIGNFKITRKKIIQSNS